MIKYPFSQFKARSILLWLIVGIFAFGMVLGALEPVFKFDEKTESNLITIFVYLTLCGWIYYVSNKAGIDVKELVKKGERVKPYIVFGLVLSLAIFSVGSSLLLGYLLSYIIPSLLTSEWFQREPNLPVSSF